MRQKRFFLRSIVLLSFVVVSALFLSSITVNAEDAHADNFVYVMTNKTPHNSVIQFSRGNDGSLTWVREVATGGGGTGATGVDPLGSQDSLVLTGDGHLLLAVNASSNEISVLKVKNSKLMLQDKVWSGGDFPNSVTLSGDLVYVLNAKGATPRINGFRLDPNGFIHPIPGARMSSCHPGVWAQTTFDLLMTAPSYWLRFQYLRRQVPCPPTASTRRICSL